MFDVLRDLIIYIWSELKPFIVINTYEEAVVLRLGKFNKTMKEGLHFKIPFADEVMSHHTIITTLNLPSQSLVTLDKKSIVVKAMVKFRITDIKTFMLEIFDKQDAISDIGQGIIKNIIMAKTWEECTDIEIDNTLTKKIRSEIKKYGIEIIQVTLTDICEMRSIRLINDSSFNRKEE
jgi:regulator of protease activity HflC (stomatin/prohibitin superfamily)